MYAGRNRVAAVANYMSGQAHSLRFAWDTITALDNPALCGEAAMLQAGAAAAETMSQLLLAVATSDREHAKAVLHAFVNDAVENGIVSV